jgi:protein-L-isoaspartate(D-aspartate) O-methyltransferase
MILDVEAARRNMITQQLRTCDVLDEKVLQAVVDIPREDFVPPEYRDLAFADMHIPLTNGQAMMTPLEEATVVQALAIKPTDTVLEVGTGTGYLTALLAAQAQRVFSLDSSPHISATAHSKLPELGVTNVELVTGDELQGVAAHAPFNAIVVNGSLPELAQATMLREQLAIDGRLFVVVGKGKAMNGWFISRAEPGWQQTILFETQLPALPSADVSEKFVF